MKNFGELLAAITPQGDIAAINEALPHIIGDSVGNEASIELDTGKLLAMASKALEVRRDTDALPIDPLSPVASYEFWYTQRAALIDLATKAVERALWVNNLRLTGAGWRLT